jgi:hypothetical protein
MIKKKDSNCLLICIIIIIDASPTSTIDDPEFIARMAASPGLRQLRQRLKSLYKWPMLLGQIDVKMQ